MRNMHQLLSVYVLYSKLIGANALMLRKGDVFMNGFFDNEWIWVIVVVFLLLGNDGGGCGFGGGCGDGGIFGGDNIILILILILVLCGGFGGDKCCEPPRCYDPCDKCCD